MLAVGATSVAFVLGEVPMTVGAVVCIAPARLCPPTRCEGLHARKTVDPHGGVAMLVVVPFPSWPVLLSPQAQEGTVVL